jgi:hypothetical protein
MTYELFTYPSCQRCEELKAFLGGTDLRGEEFSLARKEGKLKIREYLTFIKRDEKGGMVLPILILKDEGGVKAVLASREELGEWLKSKA